MGAFPNNFKLTSSRWAGVSWVMLWAITLLLLFVVLGSLTCSKFWSPRPGVFWGDALQEEGSSAESFPLESPEESSAITMSPLVSSNPWLCNKNGTRFTHFNIWRARLPHEHFHGRKCAEYVLSLWEWWEYPRIVCCGAATPCSWVWRLCRER